jgi:hypothetical protein
MFALRPPFQKGRATKLQIIANVFFSHGIQQVLGFGQGPQYKVVAQQAEDLTP